MSNISAEMGVVLRPAGTELQFRLLLICLVYGKAANSDDINVSEQHKTVQHLTANNIAKTVSVCVCVVTYAKKSKCATKKEIVSRNKLIRP